MISFAMLSIIGRLIRKIGRITWAYRKTAFPIIEKITAETANKTDDQVIAYLRENGIDAPETTPPILAKRMLLDLAETLMERELAKEGKSVAGLPIRSIMQTAYDALKESGKI